MKSPWFLIVDGQPVHFTPIYCIFLSCLVISHSLQEEFSCFYKWLWITLFNKIDEKSIVGWNISAWKAVSRLTCSHTLWLSSWWPSRPRPSRVKFHMIWSPGCKHLQTAIINYKLFNDYNSGKVSHFKLWFTVDTTWTHCFLWTWSQTCSPVCGKQASNKQLEYIGILIKIVILYWLKICSLKMWLVCVLCHSESIV